MNTNSKIITKLQIQLDLLKYGQEHFFVRELESLINRLTSQSKARVRMFASVGNPGVFPSISACFPSFFRSKIVEVKNVVDIKNVYELIKSKLRENPAFASSEEGRWLQDTLPLLWVLSSISSARPEYRQCKYCFRTTAIGKHLCRNHATATTLTNSKRVSAKRRLKKMGGQFPSWITHAKSLLSLARIAIGSVHLADKYGLACVTIGPNDMIISVPTHYINFDMAATVWGLLDTKFKETAITRALDGFLASKGMDRVMQIARQTVQWDEFASALQNEFDCKDEDTRPVFLLTWLMQALIEEDLLTIETRGRKPRVNDRLAAMKMIAELGGKDKRGVISQVSKAVGVSRMTLYAWLETEPSASPSKHAGTPNSN